MPLLIGMGLSALAGTTAAGAISVSAFGFTLATATAASATITLAGHIAIAGVGVLATSALTQGKSVGVNGAFLQQTQQSALSARPIIYGRARTGGVRVSSRTLNRWQQIVLEDIVLSIGPILSIDHLFVHGKKVSWDEVSGAVSGYADVEMGQIQIISADLGPKMLPTSLIQVFGRFGAENQAAVAFEGQFRSVAAWGDPLDLDNMPLETDTFTGLAYLRLQATQPPIKKKIFKKTSVYDRAFPNGLPQLSCVVKGRKCLDLDGGVRTWTDNPAVVLYDYLISFGGLSLADINLESFKKARDACAERVSRRKPEAKKRTKTRRYRMGGVLSTSQTLDEVVQAVLETCDGSLFLAADGAIGLQVGTEIATGISLDPAHLVAVLNWSNGPSALHAYTGVKARYIDAERDFAERTTALWSAPDLVDRYGDLAPHQMSLSLVQNHSQARQLSKIRTRKDNPIATGTLRYNLHGLKALGENFVDIDLPFAAFGVAYSGPVQVLATRVAGGGPDKSDSLAYVDIDVAVLDPDTYDWHRSEDLNPH